MVIYTCERCGYKTKIKTRFKRHLTRKFPCIPSIVEISIEELLLKYKFNKKLMALTNVDKIQVKKTVEMNLFKKDMASINISDISTNNFDESIPIMVQKKPTIKKNQCESCLKQFSRSDSLLRHQKKRCNSIKKEKKDTTTDAIQHMVKQLQEQWRQAMLQQREEIVKQVNILTQNDCHNVYNTNTINVNNFGAENIDYLSTKLLNGCINRPNIAIPKLIKSIHFHPKHPENHNIKLADDTDMVQVSEDNHWVDKDKNAIIHKLIEDKSKILSNHFDMVVKDIKRVKQLKFLRKLREWKKKNPDTSEKVEIEILKGSKSLEELKQLKQLDIHSSLLQSNKTNEI